MKKLELEYRSSRDGEVLFLDSSSIFTVVSVGSRGKGHNYVLSPEELLKVRDYINGRVRELIYDGTLRDRNIG